MIRWAPLLYIATLIRLYSVNKLMYINIDTHTFMPRNISSWAREDWAMMKMNNECVVVGRKGVWYVGTIICIYDVCI